MLLMLAAAGIDVPPANESIPLPDPLDAAVAAMRPQYRVIGQYEVGAGKTYATISAAVAQAKSDQDAAWRADFQTRVTPDYWVEILVYPGEYTECVGVPMCCSIIGMTGDPADVVIRSNTSSTLTGVLTTGGMQWIENVTLIRDTGGTAWPKYPIHHTGHGDTVTAIANSVLDYPSQTNVGMDGGAGHTWVSYACTHNGGTNMHGPSAADNPMVMAWVALSAPSVNYKAIDLNSNPGDDWPDQIWIVGGFVASASVTGLATVTHAPAETSVTTTGSRDTRTDWLIPDGLRTARSQANYYGA